MLHKFFLGFVRKNEIEVRIGWSLARLRAHAPVALRARGLINSMNSGAFVEERRQSSRLPHRCARGLRGERGFHALTKPRASLR